MNRYSYPFKFLEKKLRDFKKEGGIKNAYQGTGSYPPG
jgi:hypothetical protein